MSSPGDDAREAARRGDGKFGNQVHGLPTNGLGDLPEFYDYLIEEEMPPGTPAEWKGARVHAANGKTFNIRLIPQGSNYGRTLSLVADKGDVVEFYDAEYMHTDHGQFISRYNADTLLGKDSYGAPTGGLNLDAGNRAWQVDAAAMSDVREWLDAKTKGETK